MTKVWTFDADKLRSVSFESYEFWHMPRMAGLVSDYREGTYEPEVARCLRDVLRPGMTFFDVGASIGFYTMLAASRVERVFAFEPLPRARQVLLANVQRNKLHHVIVIAAPLFSRQVSGVMNCKRRFRSGKGNVRATTLDQFSVVPDVIKVDVEGAEADVFLGGAEMLARRKPILVLELHPTLLSRFGRTPKDPKRILRRCGYGTWTCLGKRRDMDISWWKIEE